MNKHDFLQSDQFYNLLYNSVHHAEDVYGICPGVAYRENSGPQTQDDVSFLWCWEDTDDVSFATWCLCFPKIYNEKCYSTSRIFEDATGDEEVWVRLDDPLPGAMVLTPRHCGIIVEVNPQGIVTIESRDNEPGVLDSHNFGLWRGIRTHYWRWGIYTVPMIGAKDVTSR